MRKGWTILCAVLTTAACSSAPRPKPTPPAPKPRAKSAPAPAPKPAFWSHPVGEKLRASIDLAALDPSSSPCDDFYQYACGGWLKTAKLPPDKPVWFRSISGIHERNEKLLRKIMEADAAGKPDPADPYAKKVGTFYATCMDEQKAEVGSLGTLRKELSQIDAVNDLKQLSRMVARMYQRGEHPFFVFGSEQDAKDATQVIGAADQGGLGLPDRDYYLKDDPHTKALRAAYVKHIETMLELIGERPDRAGTEAAGILSTETALAKASMDRVARRDPKAIYHRLNRAGLVKLAPRFDWALFFRQVGHPRLEAIDVRVPGFFSGLNELLGKTPLSRLRAYLRWEALESSAMAMGEKFVNARFAFVQHLTGQKKLADRWKRCVAMTHGALDQAVDRTFVRKTMGASGKAESESMVGDLETALANDLRSLAWMDAPTKKKALLKLHLVANMIAYPETWRRYDAMKIGDRSLLANVQAAARWELNRDLNKIGKPVDHGDWEMAPSTVNAYYDASLNQMVFPAGILQTPYFAPGRAAAANFGGIGMVMGHELTHGFDDQGRQYDGHGNLRDWWSKSSADAYDARTACVVKQYDGYMAVGDVHLDGKLTLGENIADVGGLKLTHAALEAHEGGKLTPQQERAMFIAFAQGWCTQETSRFARLAAKVNAHSTPRWRVNGPVSDNLDFARAFACETGTKMAPKDRCQVW